MREVSLLIIFTILLGACSEKKISYAQKLKSARAFKSSSFLGVDSPLKEEDKSTFSGLQYYIPDTNFIITAKVEWDLTCNAVQLYKDPNEPLSNYPSAKITFEIGGKQCNLIGYSKSLNNISELFLPFYDLTTSNSTYGGGRYLDVAILDKGNQQLILDFNQAYNPYCAYNSSYICPVPPFENDLKVEILAGEKLPLVDKH